MIKKREKNIGDLLDQARNMKPQIDTKDTQITTLKEQVTALNKTLSRDADQYWSDFFDKVMTEVESI
jgi:chromosome segregation ATPase